MANDQTFLRITNKDIWNKLNESIESNKNAHQEMINHSIITNGKVKANTKFLYALSGSVLVFAGWFIYHLIV